MVLLFGRERGVMLDVDSVSGRLWEADGSGDGTRLKFYSCHSRDNRLEINHTSTHTLAFIQAMLCLTPTDKQGAKRQKYWFLSWCHYWILSGSLPHSTSLSLWCLCVCVCACIGLGQINVDSDDKPFYLTVLVQASKKASIKKKKKLQASTKYANIVCHWETPCLLVTSHPNNTAHTSPLDIISFIHYSPANFLAFCMCLCVCV